MIIRILSSVILFPVLAYIIFKGGILLKFGTIFVSILGMYEFYRVVFKKMNFIHYLWFLFAIIYIILLKTAFFNFIDLIFVIFLFVSLVYMVFKHKNICIKDISVVFFGFFYIAGMFSTIYLIRNFNDGKFTVWVPFLAAWGSDIGAYFVGKTFGKHQLSPLLSPKKTLEGALGGILFSVLLCGIYGLFIYNFSAAYQKLCQNEVNSILIFSIIGFIGSVFAQLGDLTASSIKRQFNVKDYGKFMPGHGGILDRFDSLIFTSGASYIILKIVEIYHLI